MRRFQTLLIAAGLAAAPVGAVAEPLHKQAPPPQTVDKIERTEVSSKGRLGATVIRLTPELRKHFGAAEDRGVLVASVRPGSAAAAAGLRVGDLIVDVRGRGIDGAADVLSALADARKGQDVTIGIVRDRKPMSIAVKLTN